MRMHWEKWFRRWPALALSLILAASSAGRGAEPPRNTGNGATYSKQSPSPYLPGTRTQPLSTQRNVAPWGSNPTGGPATMGTNNGSATKPGAGGMPRVAVRPSPGTEQPNPPTHGMSVQGVSPQATSAAGTSQNAVAKQSLPNAPVIDEEATRTVAVATEYIRKNPRSPIGYNTRSMAYLKLGQLDKALADLNHVVLLEPQNARPLYNRGCVQRRRQEHELAIADFTRALSLDPNLHEALANRGLSYLALDRLDEALADFDHLVDRQPKTASSYYFRGLALLRRGDHVDAIEDFDDCITLNPTFADAYSARGTAYSNQGDYGQALQDYSAAIRLDPGNARHYHDRGVVLCQSGDYAGSALDLFQVTRNEQPSAKQPITLRQPAIHPVARIPNREAGSTTAPDDLSASEPATSGTAAATLNETPSDATAPTDSTRLTFLPDTSRTAPVEKPLSATERCELAQRCQAAGEIDQAIEHLTQAIAQDVQCAAAWRSRALIHEQARRYEQTIQDCNGLLSAAPDDFDAYCQRGRCHLRLNHLEPAVADFSKALELDEKSYAARWERGKVYAKMGQDGLAVEDLTLAISLKPDEYQTYIGRAVSLMRLKEFDQAIADFTTALELQPQSASAYYERGRAWFIQGNEAKAREDYERAVQLDPIYENAFYTSAN